MIDINELRRLGEGQQWIGRWYDAGCETLMAERDGEHEEVAHPMPIGLVPYLVAVQPAAISELLDRLEAAEKSDAESIAMYRKAMDERDALRAKIEQMEQQETARRVTPTAYRWRYRGAIKWQYGELTEEAARLAKEHNHEVQPLYALPGAQQCKNCNGVGDRFDPSGEKIPCDLCESHLEEIRSLVAEAAHDIISGSDFWLSISLAAKKIYALPGAQPAPSVPTALLVAVANLVAQMEIVSRVGFVDTPNDKDSCAAFCVAEGTWLELMSAIESLAAALAAAPEAKP